MGTYSIKELEQLSGIKAHTIRIWEKRLDDYNMKLIEETIAKEFHQAYLGIRQLPAASRFGVYVAYVYYLALFKKIRNTPSEQVLNSRIRIPNRQKARLFASSFFKHQLNML